MISVSEHHIKPNDKGVSVSGYQAGTTSLVIKISNRILTKDEYNKIGEEGLKFLLGIDYGEEFENYKRLIDDVFTPPKPTPNPFKKERVKDIDKQIRQLQERKKQLQEAK